MAVVNRLARFPEGRRRKKQALMPRRRIIDLRLTYDWPALKSVVSICPGSATGKFRLNDLFNLLDMHIPPGFGVRAPSRRGVSSSKKEPAEQFFDARRLICEERAPYDLDRVVLP